MKITKLMLCLLFAGLMMAFAACSSDDDDKSEPTSNAPKPKVEKRLVKIISTRGPETVVITYNADGFIEQVSENLNTSVYTYSPSKIMVTSTNEVGAVSEETYTMDNDLIINGQGSMEVDGRPWKYYDSTYSYIDGRISKLESKLELDLENGSNSSYEWNDDNLTKATKKWSDELLQSETYGYSERLDYGRVIGVVNWRHMLGDYLNPYLVMQGFFGITPLHLLQSEDTSYSDTSFSNDTQTWAYEFDKDGYPISIEEYINGNKKNTSTLTWEVCE